MAKVTARKETGRLVIDFTYRGVRCREQTALMDTPANRKKVNAVVDRLKAAVAAGTFDYSDYFPGSPQAARFKNVNGTPAAAHRPTEPAEAAFAATTPLFKDFVDIWFKNHEVEWRRSHIAVLRSTLNGHLTPYFGDRPVGGITKAHVLEFRTHLSKLPGRGESEALSNKRINGILGPLRQILNEAAETYGFPSPVTTLRPLKVRKADILPFSLTEVQSILSTVRKDYHDYFVTRFFTGMRTGEAHGLKWKYVDFTNRLILIRETFVLGEDDYTKTDGSQRDIQMSQVVFDALQRQYLATGKLSEYVFCNREGKPLDNKNFTDRVWYPLLRHLGLAQRTPYQCRHTAATLWLASGEAPEWIARQMGHTNTTMLFKVYSRYVPNLTRQDGSAIDRLLSSRFATGEVQANAPAPAAVLPPSKPPPTRRAEALAPA